MCVRAHVQRSKAVPECLPLTAFKRSNEPFTKPLLNFIREEIY